ncbi:MAG: hydroxyacid dehydrogenase, partial [Verrucomicrobia bacterium]|nr:hydroxyacid dehydrogenase [Verrucomicrobiota bacterium]
MSWKVLITARAAEEVGQPAYQLLRDSGCEVVLAPKFGP